MRVETWSRFLPASNPRRVNIATASDRRVSTQHCLFVVVDIVATLHFLRMKESLGLRRLIPVGRRMHNALYRTPPTFDPGVPPEGSESPGCHACRRTSPPGPPSTARSRCGRQTPPATPSEMGVCEENINSIHGRADRQTTESPNELDQAHTKLLSSIAVVLHWGTSLTAER